MQARTVEYVTATPRHALATLGRSVQLAGQIVKYAVLDSVRLRLPLVELLEQAWLLLKVTALPAILIAIPFGTELSVQVGGLVNQVGASSLAGAASGIGIIQQGAPIAAGLLMGGAAASAIASDLGARAIREEIDAMRVMGVDPVRRLILPRFLAMLLIAPVLCVVIIASAVLAGFSIAVSVNGVIPGSFWQSFGAFASPADLYFAIGKTITFAVLVVVIASIRGLEAKGGPRGVADAVNASVVLSVVAIFVTNLVATQVQSLFFPN
ncbi:MAG: ABC transporter permease [Rhodococcus sp. (in: high G+C Gram-positive bacteria)]